MNSLLKNQITQFLNESLWCILSILASLSVIASINPVLADQGDPYFYSFDYSTYDSDNDGVDDAVKAIFDPDFPIGYSGSVIVNVELYFSNETLIKIVSGTYLLTENDYDELKLDLGIVSIAGSFYLYGEILFNSVGTDTMTTENFRLGLSPFFMISIGLPMMQTMMGIVKQNNEFNCRDSQLYPLFVESVSY